jgi:hypothetical protein
MCGPSLRN